MTFVTSVWIIYHTSLIKQLIKLFLPTVSSFVICCKSNHSILWGWRWGCSMNKISFFMSLLKTFAISSLPTRSQLCKNNYCFSLAFENTLSKCQFGELIQMNKFIHSEYHELCLLSNKFLILLKTCHVTVRKTCQKINCHTLSISWNWPCFYWVH